MYVLKTKLNKVLLENFFSLSTLQVVTYILPLITLPYLLKVLGVEQYGMIMFAQAFIGYFNMFVDYGFNLSATKDISINRDNKNAVEEVISSVMVIKFIMLSLSFIILLSLVMLFTKFSANKDLFLCSFLIVIGQGLFPVWYFQGIENMKFITMINVTTKILFTISIFIFIHNENDYLWVPILTGGGGIIASISAFYLIIVVFKQTLSIKSVKIIKHLKAGFHIFVSSSSYVLLTNTPTFLLGIFAGDFIVGIYSAFDKIINALKNLFVIVGQVLFPYLSKVYIEDREKYKRIYFKYMIIVVIGSILIFTLSYIFSPWLIENYLNKIPLEYIYIYNLLFFVMLVGVIANLLGLNGLLVMGEAKILSLSQLIPAVVFLLTSPFVLKYTSVNYFLLLYLGVFVCIALIRAYYVFINYKKS